MITSVTERAAFAELRSGGVRCSSGPLRARCCRTGPDAPLRVAFAIGRRFGIAVERNRARRRCRAALDRAVAEAPGLGAGNDVLISCSRHVLLVPFPDLLDHSVALLEMVANGDANA